MKYTTKRQVIETAQTAGSTATTWHGARRWVLAHVVEYPIDRSHGRGRMVSPITVYARRYGADGRALDPRIVLRGRDAYLRTAWLPRIEARADVEAERRGIWAMDSAAREADRLTEPYLTYASVALTNSWPYRRSQSSWAGGEHTVSVSLTDTGTSTAAGANCATERAWSTNGKWSGTNSHAHIYTDIPTLLAFPSLMTADGLALCHAERIGAREYKVRWIEQSAGVALKTVDGYLIRGYHVRAPGIASARKKASAARKLALSATVRARSDVRVKRAKLADLKGVWIAVEDSAAAGNCIPSTEQFARTVWGTLGAVGPCAVRADVVIGARDDLYTRRALGVAMSRVSA
jgi:hypothetical protein